MKLFSPNHEEPHYQTRGTSTKASPELIPPRSSWLVDQEKGNKASELENEATIQEKYSSLTGGQRIFYGVLQGQILLWSLNPITMKIIFVLQMIRLTNRE